MPRHLAGIEGDAKVVCAGAAPGPHIAKPIQLIPDVCYALYDSRMFSSALHQARNMSNGRLYLCNRRFTDDDARAWATTPMSVLFISVIRSTVHDRRTHMSAASRQVDVDLHICRDMVNQARWVRLMRPCGVHLNFWLMYCYEWRVQSSTPMDVHDILEGVVVELQDVLEDKKTEWVLIILRTCSRASSIDMSFI